MVEEEEGRQFAAMQDLITDVTKQILEKEVDAKEEPRQPTARRAWVARAKGGRRCPAIAARRASSAEGCGFFFGRRFFFGGGASLTGAPTAI